MSATYKRFLASPSASLLAGNATLHYLTTTTSFTGIEAILKHLEASRKQVTKKKEEPLTLIESDNAIFLEVDTALEFQTSGGTYVPGIDDNFLSDRVVYLPITHIVTFNAEGKIVQIRLQWDQGALLKQLEIIGKTGRNWPIKDSREQLAVIQSTVRSAAGAAVAAQGDLPVRNRGDSTNIMRDPHATLHMPASREEIDAEAATRVMAPYGGQQRPQQRSFTDLIGEVTEEQMSPSANRSRHMSPAKSGQGKNHQPMRLFPGQEDSADQDTPKGKSSQQGIRPHPTKYDHFDFSDGTDPSDAAAIAAAPAQRPQKAGQGNHNSQWSFDDFTTPAKAKASRAVRGEATRHWDTEGDIVDKTAAHPAGKARRDAETHFELQDDGERVAQPGQANAKPRGSMQNENLGLYKNKVFDEDDETPTPTNTLSNITNLKDRGKDFAPHFAMTDDSPAPTKGGSQPLLEGKQKTLKMMDSNWSNYDESPMTTVRKNATEQEDQKINIAGDGMGGRKGTNRDWLYGASEPQAAPKPKGGSRPAAKQNFWDY